MLLFCYPLHSYLTFFSLFVKQPENILFTDKSITGTLKLIDFGMAKEVKEKLHEFCGTPEFQGNVVVLVNL